MAQAQITAGDSRECQLPRCAKASHYGSASFSPTSPICERICSNRTSPIPLIALTLKDNWQLDPTIVPEKLQAIQCACRWVLFGFQQAGPESWMLGPGPPPSPSSPETQQAARHCFFKVSDRLWPLDPSRRCWLHHAERRSEIPQCACYWAGCRGKYIWIDAGGMQSLSEFTLIVQTIARSVYDLTLQPAASTQQVT
jgi:hypothetical protein